MKTLTIFGLALSVVLLFAYLIVCWVVVDIALVANQNAIDDSQRPHNFGIQDYESVVFSPLNEEEIDLRGWWIPHDNARATVIWVHGIDGTRAGNMEFLASLYKDCLLYTSPSPRDS